MDDTDLTTQALAPQTPTPLPAAPGSDDAGLPPSAIATDNEAQTPTPPAVPGVPAATDGPKKPPSWGDVKSQPGFSDLPFDKQDQVREQYFKDVVAPNVPKDAIDQVKAAFDKDTAIPGYVVPDATDKEVMRQVGLTARDTVEGLGGMLNFVGSPITKTMNYADSKINEGLGTHIPMAQNPGQLSQSLMDYLGAPKPQGALETIANDTAKGVVGAAGGLGAAGLVGKGLAAIRSSADISPLLEKPITQMVSGATSSAAGSTTKEMGGGPYAQMAASILGGGLPFALGHEGVNVPENISADQQRTAASMKYEEAKQAGGTLTQQFVNKFMNSIPKVLPTPTSAGAAVLGGKSPGLEMVERMQDLRKGPLDLESAADMDQSMTRMANKYVDPKTGKILADGNDILAVQRQFRQMIQNASPSDITGGTKGFQALNEARYMWQQQAKLRDVEAVLTRADGRANEATLIQNGFSTLAGKGAKMRGWTDDEVSALKAASKSNIITDLMQHTLGSRLGPIAAASIGHGPGLLAAHVGATAARGIATAAAKGRAEKLAQIITDNPTTGGGLLNNIGPMGNAAINNANSADNEAEEEPGNQ